MRDVCGVMLLAFSLGARGTTAVNGTTLTVVAATPKTDYLVTNGGTLNVQPGASATRIVVNDSTLNMDGATVSSGTVSNAAVIDVHQSNATISNSSISNSAERALIVSADNDSSAPATVTVTNSTMTGFPMGASVGAFSTLTVSGGSVTGVSATSVGMTLFAGNAVIENGANVNGIQNGIVFSTDGFSTIFYDSALVINHSTVTGLRGSALVVGGAPFTLENGANATILVENGSSLYAGNGELLTVLADSHADFTVDDSILTGNIVVNDGGSADVTMRNAAALTGSMTNVGSLNISDSLWTLTGDSTVTAINGSNGSINTGVSNLTVQSVAGSGTLTSEMTKIVAGPSVHITNTMSGNWQVAVTDEQHNYGAGELQPTYIVAQVDGANTATVGGKSDIGAYRYTSQVNAKGDVVIVQDADEGGEVPAGGGEGEGGNGDAGGGNGNGGTGGGAAGGDGGTPPPVKPALNSGANAAVDSMSVASVRAIWDTQFSALHLRQQNLRDFIPRPSSGTFWAQGYGGNYKLDNGYGSGTGDMFDTTVEGASIGFDKVLRHTDDSDLIGGLYASFVNEDRRANESNGNLHGYSVGAYGTWMHRSGWYVEGMMAYGNFNNSFSAAYHGDPNVSRVSADDWRIASAAVALELGREFVLEDGWSVQPAVGFRYLHQGSQHFTTDLGHQVSSEGIGSSGVNASVTVSRMLRDGGTQYRPYLRFGYAHEFNGTQNVQYAGASINTALDASRGFVDVGLAASIAKRHEIFVDYQYQKGRNVENTYLVNLGYRYTF